jgi:mannose-6-phosphate isomerase-like protein (cupin superfamily)
LLVKENEVKGIKAPQPHERILKMLISPDTVGSKFLSVGLSIIPPNSTSNPHVHQNEEEVFYVLSGRGKVMLENSWLEIEKGTTIYVKPGTLHQLVNTGDETLKVLWTESPPHRISTLYEVHKIPK